MTELLKATLLRAFVCVCACVDPVNLNNSTMLKTLTSWLNSTRFIKYIQTFTDDFRYLEKHFPHSKVTEASVDFSINNARMYTVDGYICLSETPVQAIHLHYLKKNEKKSYHTHIQQDLPLYIAWSKKCFVLNVYIVIEKDIL